MSYTIIDAHAHLWLNQDTTVNGQAVRSLEGGRSEFFGEIRQMMPPYMTDGRNTAEMLIANMDYAQVSAAVITQEFIDGNQDDYLLKVQQEHPDRLLCCALIDPREKDFVTHVQQAHLKGFRAAKLPAGRLITPADRTYLTDNRLMDVFAYMQDKEMILSVDLADGDEQVAEMEELIAAFPSLKIAVGHFGMVTRKGWLEQIRLARHPNVRIESGGITWLFHSEFYPYQGAVSAIREAAGLVGMDKLMWGSDYPRTMTAITYRMSWDFLERTTELQEHDKALFLGVNAAAFYGFENARQLPYIKNMVED